MKILFAAMAVFSLASCLKDEKFDNRETGHDLTGVPKIIELGFISEPGHEKSVALAFVDKSVDATLFFVRLAADEVASEDITVTLDSTGAYNKLRAAHPTFRILPASFYTYGVPTFKVVIPKGQRQSAPFKITTNTIRFDPSTTYGLYFKIVAVDKPGYVISGNFGEFLTILSAKNDYDGNYKMTFTTTGWDAFGISSGVERTWPSNGDGTSIFMITTSGNTVDLFDEYAFGTFIQPAFTAAGGATGFGATAPRFTFDNATRKLTSVVNTAAPDARNRALRLNTAAANTNYFDPATHDIYFDYIMSQTGRPDQSIKGVLTYVGPRP